VLFVLRLMLKGSMMCPLCHTQRSIFYFTEILYNYCIVLSSMVSNKSFFLCRYASAFYGPFREALDSNPRFGDKKT
jgi:glutaredoxin-related protein